MEEMDYRHYIHVDDSGNIVDGFSDAFRAPAEDSICINEQGGYQFRLSPEGPENPALLDRHGVPIWRWDGRTVLQRTSEEIEAARMAAFTPAALRERAYNSEAMILWDGGMITVTQAAQKWQYYAAEGSDKAEELTGLIARAKQIIREKYPDGDPMIDWEE